MHFLTDSLQGVCHLLSDLLVVAIPACCHATAAAVAALEGFRVTGTSAREGEVREQHYGLRAQKRPLPGTRPAPLLEVLPQVGLQRHAVDQIVDAVSGPPTLDVPVPQMVNQLLSFLTALDSFVPEQVIEVPKISTLSRCPRTVLSVPQTAEQLMEVPTIISFSSLREIVEQNVDIPVPHGRVGDGGLLGFHPGQSSTAKSGADHRSVSAEQIVDIPAPRGGRVLHPASSSSGLQGTATQGFFFFALFPKIKNCALELALGSELLAESSPSTPAAQRGGGWRSCSLSRSSSGRRHSGPGFVSSSAPLPRRFEGRGRRGGRGVRLRTSSLRGRARRRQRPKMPCIMARMYLDDRCSGLIKAGIGGDNAPRAVFPSLVGRPRMLCILPGTDLKDSCSGMYKAGFSGVSAPRAVLPEAYRKIGLFGRWGVFFLRPLCIWKSLVRAFG